MLCSFKIQAHVLLKCFKLASIRNLVKIIHMYLNYYCARIAWSTESTHIFLTWVIFLYSIPCFKISHILRDENPDHRSQRVMMWVFFESFLSVVRCCALFEFQNFFSLLSKESSWFICAFVSCPNMEYFNIISNNFHVAHQIQQVNPLSDVSF